MLARVRVAGSLRPAGSKAGTARGKERRRAAVKRLGGGDSSGEVMGTGWGLDRQGRRRDMVVKWIGFSGRVADEKVERGGGAVPELRLTLMSRREESAMRGWACGADGPSDHSFLGLTRRRQPSNLMRLRIFFYNFFYDFTKIYYHAKLCQTIL
jgi:hypothetical protein